MEEVIPDGYTDLGWLPEEISEIQELNSLSVLAKESYLNDILRGEIGNELVCMGYERGWIEMELFENMVEHPNQIRDGGGGALLLICQDGGYWESADKYIEDRYYAMRIIPVTDKDGNSFWEFVDFDLQYNLKRQDYILWKS